MTQAIDSTTVRVTADNFVRAESHMYFGNVIKQGGFGEFYHYRDLMPIDDQTVVRANRDTLYSGAVFDLDAGPVTIALPDSGERFRSMCYFEKNAQNAYTLNGITAKKNADGSVTIQFGGCDGTVPNCLPITPGWNYMVRLYRPRAEILNASWHFPEAEPAA